MVGEAVQQRAGQALRPEDLGPLVEEQFGPVRDNGKTPVRR